MNYVLASDSITLKKGANSKIREWYLKKLGTNQKLIMPSLNNAVAIPFNKESVLKR